MDGEKLLHLFVGESSFNEADNIVSTLRDAGFAVRERRIEDQEDLEEGLKEQQPDLIICSTALEELAPEQVIALLERESVNAPLIMLGDTADAAQRISAMRSGACDLVARGDSALLQLVVAREFKQLQNLREMVFCKGAYSESEKRCHALLDSSRDAIAYIHEGMHIYSNPAYLERFGYDSSDELEGVPVMDMVSDEDQPKIKEYLRTLSKGKTKENELELQLVTFDGKSFQARMEFSSASIDGEPCTQVIIRDQRASKDLEEKIKHLSKQDLLTGLCNRPYFLEELGIAVEKVKSGTTNATLLYIDIDNFREIKEQVGLAGGDLVITDVARTLQEKVSPEETLARFGDSSFTVLSYNKEKLGAEMLAEELRHAVADLISEVGVQSINPTCSVGISMLDGSCDDAHEAISHADLACEVAKQKGGDRVHIHDPVGDRKAQQQHDEGWTAQIKSALSENRFRLLFQPIVSLQGDASENYEVLMRMLDPQGEEIMPGKFIQAAIQSGLLAVIDRWVIAHAAKVVAEQRRGGRNTRLYIKLSGSSVIDEKTLGWVRECLQKQRLQGDALTFEIDENDASKHLKVAKALVDGLQQLHCGIALEHFGRGSNSFNLLKHLPADILKIDGGLIHRLASSRENQAMVKSITELAKESGKQTIAEFVEDANSLAVLWGSGVNYIQGYFLQGPENVMEYDFVNDGLG